MKKLLCLVVISLLLTSCATIVSGTKSTVNLQPSDIEYDGSIKVQVSNKNTIQTVQLPGSVQVPSGYSPLKIVVKDKCFRETTTTLNSTINYWFLGNVFTLGLIGTTTDALTGALWTYDDAYVVNTERNGVCR